MNRIKQLKLVSVIIGILIFGVLILYKLIYIQSIESEGLIVPKIIYPETRGDIYSSDMQLLASSPINYNISFDPTVPSSVNFNEKLHSLADSLQKYFPEQIDSESIINKINNAKQKNRKYVNILKNISFSELNKIKTFPFFEDGKIPGGYIEEKTSSSRVLLHGDLARVVLGNVYKIKKDSIFLGFGNRIKPKHGIEKYYDYLLRGQEGFQLTKKIKGNIDKNLFSKNSIKPEEGKDIVTTINLELQKKAHSILQRHLIKNDARYGILMVMEVSTGNMMAVVNLERDIDGQYIESFNYAVRGPKKFKDRPSVKIEPGSTFKLASYMVYFEQLGDKNDTINALGNESKLNESIHKFPGVKKRVHDSKKLGLVNLEMAFAESSNIAICKLIFDNYNLNAQQFLDGLHELKLGEKSNIDLDGEDMPVLYKDASNLRPGSLVSLAYGYEMGFSPIQILTFYNSIANNGIRVKPKIVTHYIENNNLINLIPNDHNESFICSQKTINQAKSLLRSVVTHGTANILSNLPIAISGKTGTTKVNYSQPVDSLIWYQASFAGFFPSQSPEYSVYVLIDDPKNEYYASKVAVPVVKDLIEEYYYPPSLFIEDSVNVNFSKTNFFAKNSQLSDMSDVLDIDFFTYDSGKYVNVKFDSISQPYLNSIYQNNYPNVEGMQLGDALYVLEKEGYNVEIKSGFNGRVIKQDFNVKDEINTIFLSVK